MNSVSGQLVELEKILGFLDEGGIEHSIWGLSGWNGDKRSGYDCKIATSGRFDVYNCLAIALALVSLLPMLLLTLSFEQ